MASECKSVEATETLGTAVEVTETLGTVSSHLPRTSPSCSCGPCVLASQQTELRAKAEDAVLRMQLSALMLTENLKTGVFPIVSEDMISEYKQWAAQSQHAAASAAAAHVLSLLELGQREKQRRSQRQEREQGIEKDADNAEILMQAKKSISFPPLDMKPEYADMAANTAINRIKNILRARLEAVDAGVAVKLTAEQTAAATAWTATGMLKASEAARVLLAYDADAAAGVHDVLALLEKTSSSPSSPCSSPSSSGRRSHTSHTRSAIACMSNSARAEARLQTLMYEAVSIVIPPPKDCTRDIQKLQALSITLSKIQAHGGRARPTELQLQAIKQWIFLEDRFLRASNMARDMLRFCTDEPQASDVRLAAQANKLQPAAAVILTDQASLDARAPNNVTLWYSSSCLSYVMHRDAYALATYLKQICPDIQVYAAHISMLRLTFVEQHLQIGGFPAVVLTAKNAPSRVVDHDNKAFGFDLETVMKAASRYFSPTLLFAAAASAQALTLQTPPPFQATEPSDVRDVEQAQARAQAQAQAQAQAKTLQPLLPVATAPQSEMQPLLPVATAPQSEMQPPAPHPSWAAIGIALAFFAMLALQKHAALRA